MPDEVDSLTIADLEASWGVAPSPQDRAGGALSFFCAGSPVAQPRPRWVGRKMVSTPRSTAKRWKLAVIGAAAAARAGSAYAWHTERVALCINMLFVFPPTKGQLDGTPHTQKPDKDNLEKLVLDAIVKAKLMPDDSQVSIGQTEKRWGKASGVYVSIIPVTGARQPLGLDTAAPSWLKIGESS
jgi:Holliday junction resolvase RusA-like endonuclease